MTADAPGATPAERRQILARALAVGAVKSRIRTAFDTQPCGHCRKPVLSGGHRKPGAVWWCDDRMCRAERDRRRSERHRRRHGGRERSRSTCEHCGGPYYRNAGSTSPYRLCTRRACETTRERWQRWDRRQPDRSRPIGEIGADEPGVTWREHRAVLLRELDLFDRYRAAREAA
ncbi:hypothetical protein MXD62_20140 [Frankia sp. Mgl5]|uniref:hypothetical protein n=1 Tax=Frankia sp. Mgl5 TaxID=2933793 RepID=UPI00200E0914|nr:hypothetical protein [Frankia sp. Mgl5]MCK9929461.1 hypothetical protein [Frankia sp. Mgl5]